MSLIHRKPQPEPDPNATEPTPGTGVRAGEVAVGPGAGSAEAATAGTDVTAVPAGVPDDAGRGTDSARVPPTGSPSAPRRAPKQTLAGRVWIAIVIAAILLVLLIIFIAENTHSITVSFVGLHGHISEALALLIAVVVGIAITTLVGSARILQLSLEVRRHRRRLKDLGEL